MEEKTFGKNIFGGYNRKEVDQYTEQSEELIYNQKKMITDLELRIQNAEKRISKLEEIESKLMDTIKDAESAGSREYERAQKEGERIIEIAREKAGKILEEAHLAYQKKMDLLQDETKKMEHFYILVETHASKLINEMSATLSHTQEGLEKMKSARKVAYLEQDFFKRQNQKLKNLALEDIEPAEEISEEESKSFFDELN